MNGLTITLPVAVEDKTVMINMFLNTCRCVGLIPMIFHSYTILQQEYFPTWIAQPFRISYVGTTYILFITTLSGVTLLLHAMMISPLDQSSLPCEKSHLPPFLLFENIYLPVLAAILVKSHRSWCAYTSVLISFFFSMISCVIAHVPSAAYYGICAFYLLETIVVYDNEQTLRLLYLNYIHQEENLITKLKSTNEKELLLMKGEELRYLIGNVAHDMKSPLHGFSLELETLRKRLLSTQDLESLESIAALRRISSFLLMTINRAIDYSKASSGIVLAPSLETVDLNETLDWVVKCVSPLNELPITVEPLPASLCANVVTDKHWLMENLLCLVSNAQKFTGEGSITLRCVLENPPTPGPSMSWLVPPSPRSQLAATSDSVVSMTRDLFLPFRSSQSLSTSSLNIFVRIEVEDSGIGIGHDERTELFQPFKQAQRRVGGTGLGLYSLSKRVEALGGSCGISDRRDGGPGSLFWFNFPYHPGELMTAAAVVSPQVSEESKTVESIYHVVPQDVTDSCCSEANFTDPKSSDSSSAYLDSPDNSSTPSAALLSHSPKLEKKEENRRILLVEDSVLIQKTTSRALTSEGYVVDIARNGLECLRMVKEHDYGFILMDIQMPVMDGIEATKRLREIEKSAAMGQAETKDDEASVELLKLFDSPAIESLLGSVGRQCVMPHKYIIIGLSASSDNLTMEEALHAGMNEFLSKPLTISRLKQCLERYCLE